MIGIGKILVVFAEKKLFVDFFKYYIQLMQILMLAKNSIIRCSHTFSLTAGNGPMIS